jgi:hypothetical protein
VLSVRMETKVTTEVAQPAAEKKEEQAAAASAM